jgi:hypothetical protein
MLLEYDGNEYIRFVYLVKSLFASIGIKQFHIYHGKSEQKVQIFIPTDTTLQDATSKLEEISDALSTKMSKKWKLLPQQNLPNEYNIATLPYGKVEEK